MKTERSPMLTLTHALAVTATGLIAGTALAHVFEMPHKLAMAEGDWLPVQQLLYTGWGAKLFWLDVIAVSALALIAVRSAPARAAALTALALVLIADVAVFLVWIAPTNAAVDAWTAAVPMADWQALRTNWEYGHAARAVLLTFATMAAAAAVPRGSELPSPKRVSVGESAPAV